MGVRKGQNNFLKFQDEKSSGVLKAISAVLQGIPKGLVFTKVRSILLYVSNDSEVHVDSTTLKKNRTYFKLILEFFVHQPGAAGMIRDEDSNRAIAQIKGLSQEAELNNLKNEIRRLKTIIKLQKGTLCATTDPRSNPSMHLNERPADIKIATTSKALFLLLDAVERKEIGMMLDKKRGEIIDTTEEGEGHIIVNADQLGPFLEWEKLHSKTVLSSMIQD